MQGNSPWYTPPPSALNNETTNSSNYFYNNNNQQWNRPSNGYDSQYYQGQSNYSMNGPMRSCENFGAPPPNAYHNNYECPPMYFRQGAAGDFSAPCPAPTRNRGDRPRQPSDVPPVNFDGRMRNAKPLMAGAAMKMGDNEDENFSSVFTQSLTSLYSHDVDGNFNEDKNGDDPEIVGTCMRMKAEDTSSPSNNNNNSNTNEYGFTSVYESEEATPAVNFENVKIKTEPYTSPENTQYEGFAMDDMYLRRRGTLAEAYNRKRKHSVPAMYGSAMNGNSEGKRCREFQPDSQWIPNSLSDCRGQNQLTKCAYQQGEFTGNFDRSRFHLSRFKKRHAMKFRTSGRKGELGETKSLSMCKKVQKKISPLTVYVKILDDVIMDVTCRRYKKRTKPADDELCNNQNLDTYESFESLYEMVGKILYDVVDKVAKTMSLASKPLMDLAKLPPAKGSELLFKFCHDYGLDYRDFTDFYEIIGTDVTNYKDEVIEKRRNRRTLDREVTQNEYHRRRKRRTAEQDEAVCRRSERVSEKELKDNKPETPLVAKTEPVNEAPKLLRTFTKGMKISKRVPEPEPEAPVRVLRSLPSRQPTKATKKAKTSRLDLQKERYPKRNLRTTKNPSVNLGKKLKIVIDLSKETEQPEILLESDSSGAKINLENTKDSESKDADEVKGQLRTVKSASVIDVGKDDSTSLSADDLTTGTASSPVVVLQPVAIPKIKEERNIDQKDEDVSLRQPPQLVRMTDNNNPYLDENQGKGSTLHKQDSSYDISPKSSERRNSSEFGDNVPPPTLRPSSAYRRPSSDHLGHRAKAADSDYDDDEEEDDEDDSDKLVIDTTAKECDAHAEDEKSKKDETQQKSSLPLPNNDIRDTASASHSEDNSGDECMVVHSDIAKPKAVPAKNKVPVNNAVDDMPFDSNSIRQNIMGEKPGLERMEEGLSEDEKVMSSGSKSSTKDEQDESILRTLLLESEVAACSGTTKDLEPSSPLKAGNPVNSENALNSDAMRASDFSNSHLPSFTNDQQFDLCEPLRIPKYQSYHDAYVNSLSPETYEAAQRQFREHSSSSSSLPQLPKCEPKETIVKDPQQLKEKIKKLKNEIVYLQLMAEQKEKEKIAIVCFKRYKEEILKRIYKAYAFSVQDHVRDWIFAKRENAADNHTSTSAATSSLTSSPSHRSDLRSDQAKTLPETLREEAVYPVPAPAHSSSTSHRAHAFHGLQSSPKSRNSQATSEKVSAIETMVAKASENYGLDMTNLRDRLRSSPETSSSTILQKVLSSKNTSRNSTPEHSGSGPWSPDMSKRNTMPTKPVASIASKVYPDQYNSIPLDMIITPTSRSSPSGDIRGSRLQPQDHSRINNLDTPMPSNTVGDRTQSLMSEPAHQKSQRNPYRSWSIQTGGRITEDRSVYSKPSSISSPSSSTPSSGNAIDLESPLQKQLNSHKVQRPVFSLASPGIKSSNSSFEPTKSSSGYESNRLRSDMQELPERASSGNMECNKKQEEECRQLGYASNVSTSLSSGSTMPYGGHIIPNTNPLPSTSANTKAPTPNASSTPLCMGCGVSDAKFLCSGCRKHWYCSAQCQSLRWPEHSRTCAGRMFQQSTNSYS